MTGEDQLAAGREALAAGRWEEARAAFAAALADAETPEALDGLGVALWWLGDTQAAVAATERAYAGFRRAGDAAGAAGAAVFLCSTWATNFDNHPVARGWLARAERVAGEADPGPLQGWLLLLRGFLEPDPDRAHALVRRVLELARETGDVDLELCAMGDLGVSLVAAGREGEGMALIDEAMAGTLGGEHRRLDTVVVACCDMLVACDLASDLRRAAQWCQVADRFINRYGCPFLYARCRTLYGSVLLARGRWDEAERELLAAVRMAEGTGPGAHADALARLAELLERSLEDHGVPQVHGEHRLRAAAALETLVAARVALGELDAATTRWPPWPPWPRPAWPRPGSSPRRPGGPWSGPWSCSAASTCPTRWPRSGWSWPGPWPPPTRRWPWPRPPPPVTPWSAWARPPTPTPPTPCAAPSAPAGAPAPSGSGL